MKVAWVLIAYWVPPLAAGGLLALGFYTLAAAAGVLDWRFCWG